MARTQLPESTNAPPTIQPAAQETYLFEIAYEVCWQSGGIYTVLRSKAPAMTELWGDRYCLVGPYHQDTAETEFEPRRPAGVMARAIEALEAAGIRCHFGRWLVGGNPRVLLIDTESVKHKLAEMKYFLWKDFGLATRGGDWELDNVIALGYAVRDFLKAFCQARQETNLKNHWGVIAHCHEWMGSLAIPLIRHGALPVATVFTTHATLLGRYLSSSEADLAQSLPYVNTDEAARHFDIYDRFSIERAAAQHADVFTAVSEITADEAGTLLGRPVDIVLPNGLNIQRFAAIHEFQNLHRQYKEKINEFVMSHFFPSYSFDLDNTLYFFSAGRYEHRNKGVDVFIEALARLNHRLREAGSTQTVVAFLVMPAPFRSINVDVLGGRAMFEELRAACQNAARQMGNKLFMRAAEGVVPSGAELLDQDSIIRLKRLIQARRCGRLPIICTHDLKDDEHDPVLSQLRSCRLVNDREDRVKVVFHPEFMKSTTPLFGLDYDQFVRGCHLGVFPSYYEPWGYTPMECMASGIPAVTSDLSGFGAYLKSHVPEHQSKGLFIVDRRGADLDKSADDLARLMEWFCSLNRRQRVVIRNDVEGMAEQFDWSRLVVHYSNAHALAMQRYTDAQPAGN